jgi:hypothetical protein
MESFLKDLKFGGIAGLMTGPLIAWLEVIKVNIQINKYHKLNLSSCLKLTIEETLKMTPQFSMLFGMVCAIEFSVNQRIRFIYGDYPAILASAFTGSLFLTPAEHLMCISSIKKAKAMDSIKTVTNSGILRLWTGMSSMFIRESFFIFNLFLAGKNIGKGLQKNFGNDTFESEEFWKAVGRTLCGLLTTTTSHPFDTLARKMQIIGLKNPKEKPRLVSVFRSTSSLELFSGLAPRLIIANLGGVSAAYLFERFHYKSKKHL